MSKSRVSGRPFVTAVLAAALVAGLLGGFGGEAWATTVVKMDIEKLSVLSDAVVLGRVEGFQSRWEEGRIVTDVALRVVVPIKGKVDAGTVITVRRMGGTVGDLRQWTPGATDFAVGERALVFLDRATVKGVATPVVLGMAQGKWELAEAPDGTLHGVRDLHELTLAEVEELPDGGQRILRIEEGANANEGVVPLDLLLYRIAGSLKAAGQPVRAELLDRIGPELSRPWSFAADFARLPALPGAKEVRP